jgi:CPA2 family monovalent cation:H+ antiporter-2
VSRGVLLLELGAIVLGLAVFARLAVSIGLSPIPLYLLAGLAFGKGGLIPVVTADEFIEVGAEIGVILLLLMLGLEYSAHELTEGLRTGWRSGALDVVLNFSPGFIAGLVLGWGGVAALLLGGVTYISSSGIVAKLIADLGWIGNRETPTVLSLLVQEDLVMAAFLPVAAVLLAGTAPLSAMVSVIAAVGAVVAVIAIALRWGETLSRAVFSRSDEAMLLSIFGITLLVAGAAEQLQVSAAVGAFLVGIAISAEAADRARSLLSPLRDLFGAVFFVFFGLQIDPASIPPVLWPALGLGVVGLATKWLTGSLAARRAGVGWRGRLRAGSVLVARGEFSIAIAALGVSAGVESTLGPLTAAYVLTLAVLGPLLARLADLRTRRSVPPQARVTE